MSLTEKAMLAKISFSIIGMRKKDVIATNRSNVALQTSQQAGIYQKCKISRDNIASIIRIRDAAAAYHRKMTTPFTPDGWGLIGADMVMAYGKNIGDYKSKFWMEFDDLKNKWPAIVNSEKIRLGPLFNLNEYPSQNELEKEFDFQHQLKPVPHEGHIIIDLEAEALQEIKDAITAENVKNMKRSTTDMWQRLLDPVSKMADICMNDKKIFESLIGNLEEIVDILPGLNILRDPSLTQMANEIKSKLLGHTAGQLRDDKALKKTLGSEAEVLTDKIENYLGRVRKIK